MIHPSFQSTTSSTTTNDSSSMSTSSKFYYNQVSDINLQNEVNPFEVSVSLEFLKQQQQQQQLNYYYNEKNLSLSSRVLQSLSSESSDLDDFSSDSELSEHNNNSPLQVFQSIERPTQSFVQGIFDNRTHLSTTEYEVLDEDAADKIVEHIINFNSKTSPKRVLSSCIPKSLISNLSKRTKTDTSLYSNSEYYSSPPSSSVDSSPFSSPSPFHHHTSNTSSFSSSSSSSFSDNRTILTARKLTNSFNLKSEQKTVQPLNIFSTPDLIKELERTCTELTKESNKLMKQVAGLKQELQVIKNKKTRLAKLMPPPATSTSTSTSTTPSIQQQQDESQQ